MDERGWIARRGFWPLALLWLPAGFVTQAVVRFLPGTNVGAEPGMWVSSAIMSASSVNQTLGGGSRLGRCRTTAAILQLGSVLRDNRFC